MSQAQEQRRVGAWEAVHKDAHSALMAKVKELESQLDVLEQDSDEYKLLRATYDRTYNLAEAYFMKFYEP